MIELRTYEDDAAGIAAFATPMWQRILGGKVAFPIWDEAYVDWQFTAERPRGRELLLAAYDGTKLVGCIFAERFSFKVREESVEGSMGSLLAIDVDYKGKGIGRRLAQEYIRRHREYEAPLIIGYLVPGTSGPKFWKGSADTRVLGDTGLWARVLDYERMAEWTLSTAERVALKMLGPVLGRPPPAPDAKEIRPYRSDDLDACLELANGLLAHADLGYIWSRSRLAHQLEYKGIPRTLVWEEAGIVKGFLNYYALGMSARGETRAGMIDLLAFADDVTRSARTTLLRAALAEMAAHGMTSSVIMNLPCYPAQPLLAAGFVPVFGEKTKVISVAPPGLVPDGAFRFALTYR